MEQDNNPYIFGNPETDRQRLETQSRLFIRYIRAHARAFCGDKVHTILDGGCADGQLGFALQDVYPGATLTGVDRDAAVISRAQSRATQEQRPATFVQSDIQQGMPAGPFDLVFLSNILLHTQRPEAVLLHAYAVMGPGATLWVIDSNGETRDATFPTASGTELATLFFKTLTRLGAHPNIASELPALLSAAGFVDYARRESTTDHPTMSNNAADQMQVNAVALGALFNARQATAALNGIALADFDNMFVNFVNAMMNDTRLSTPPLFAVITAHKPDTGE